ncbi:MAG: TrmH family RNA methyltransferase [Treponema sp.]|jgi:TrmH family RNA methyltransferase|nr:TrmH family RNA methyltransferase [Treponema sp.]
MIPRHKLEKLPRSQRLRKIAKLFGLVEYRLSQGGTPSPGELEGLEEALALLTGDGTFSLAAAAALKTAAGSLGRGEVSRWALNTVRHILLAETGRSPADWDLIGAEGRLDPQKRRPFPGMTVYLEDIRSPFNVGAMFRTAESFGAEELLLSPLCADPLHPRAVRTAMGCVEILSWKRLPVFPEDTAEAAARTLSQTLPAPLFALETGGTDIAAFPFPPRGTLIVGSEELGVSPEALAAAEASLGRLSVPTYGAKGSLNVSVAFGIAMAAWAFHLSNYF